ncbi:hypothetical protein J2Y02_003887 [Neobacillus drentensis]|nr:hypothetical protein [Neobacillus drentensis]
MERRCLIEHFRSLIPFPCFPPCFPAALLLHPFALKKNSLKTLKICNIRSIKLTSESEYIEGKFFVKFRHFFNDIIYITINIRN